MDIFSIIDFIFGFFKNTSFKKIGSYLGIGVLVLGLGGLAFYQFYSVSKLKHKNEELKKEIFIKNTKINNLKIQNEKLKDTIKVKKFENEQTMKKEKLKNKIKNSNVKIIIKKDETKSQNSLKNNSNKNFNKDSNDTSTTKSIKDLNPGKYIIEIN